MTFALFSFLRARPSTLRGFLGIQISCINIDPEWPFVSAQDRSSNQCLDSWLNWLTGPLGWGYQNSSRRRCIFHSSHVSPRGTGRKYRLTGQVVSWDKELSRFQRKYPQFTFVVKSGRQVRRSDNSVERGPTKSLHSRGKLAPRSKVRGSLRDRRSSEVVVSPRGSFHHEVPRLWLDWGRSKGRAGNTCCSLLHVSAIGRETDQVGGGGGGRRDDVEERRELAFTYLALVVVPRRVVERVHTTPTRIAAK